MARWKLSSGFGVVAALGLAAASFVAACGAGGDSGSSGFTGGSGGQTSSNGSKGSGSDVGSGPFVGSNGSGSGSNGSGGGCAGTSSKAAQVPLDMYIMLDQSGSMDTLVTGTNSTRWQVVTKALTDFLNQPGLGGVAVGIQYFALPDTCNPAVYAQPEVPITPLPGAASAIINSMGQHMPSTGTPTKPALEGAIQYAKGWQSANPTHVTVVVFATDGLPQVCDTSLPNINAVAAAGFNGMPKIPTFVIGVGSALQNLNGIAAAGGTMAAFLVDNANAGQAFLDAMNKIRGTVLACTYLIPAPPPGQMLDFGKVNVEFTPGAGGNPITIPKVNDLASCPAGGLGWYYDNNSKPTQIILCPDACTQISADAKGVVNVILGCGTVIK